MVVVREGATVWDGRFFSGSCYTGSICGTYTLREVVTLLGKWQVSWLVGSLPTGLGGATWAASNRISRVEDN